MAINLSGPLCSTGYGYCLFGLLKGLERVGAEPALFPVERVQWDAFPEPDRHVIARGLERARRFDPNSPSLRVWHQWGMAEGIGRGTRLGLSFTELDRLKPSEAHSLNSLDVVLCPSRWAKDVAARSGVTPRLEVVPMAVDHDNVVQLAHLPQDGPTVFVNVGKFEYRKGHELLLKAFLRAFGPEDDVRLVLLCENPFLDRVRASEWETYYTAHPLADKVVMYRRQPTQADVARVLSQAHCGVFPARAEGWNMGAAELLAAGRHVVLTDYSGHTEYAEAAGAVTVPVRDLEPADDGQWFHSADPEWAGHPGRWAALGEVHVELFASHMRELHGRRRAGGLPLNQKGIDHFRRWTWEAAARRVVEIVSAGPPVGPGGSSEAPENDQKPTYGGILRGWSGVHA